MKQLWNNSTKTTAVVKQLLLLRKCLLIGIEAATASIQNNAAIMLINTQPDAALKKPWKTT